MGVDWQYVDAIQRSHAMRLARVPVEGEAKAARAEKVLYLAQMARESESEKWSKDFWLRFASAGSGKPETSERVER